MREILDRIGCFSVILLVVAGISYAIYDCRQRSLSIPMDPERIIVEQVMEHEPHHYSIKYKQDNGELITIDLGRNCGCNNEHEVKLIADVPEGEPSWALLNRAKNRLGEEKYISGGEIHLHSAKEINGAGWDHGKFGRGQTVPIE